MPERKTLSEDLFYRGSSANLPHLHTCENKVPFWDFSQFAVTKESDEKQKVKEKEIDIKRVRRKWGRKKWRRKEVKKKRWQILANHIQCCQLTVKCSWEIGYWIS